VSSGAVAIGLSRPADRLAYTLRKMIGASLAKARWQVSTPRPRHHRPACRGGDVRFRDLRTSRSCSMNRREILGALGVGATA